MANAVIAQNQGHDYQARYFWLNACRLFQPHTKVARVAYELNRIKSFDDVVVTYNTPISDERGDPVEADYYQVKFHVNQAGAFTYEALIDPAFINATSVSLLQKLMAAQRAFAPKGVGSRFIITSPWIIHPDDPLSELVSNQGGELRLQVLFDDTGPNSKMGRIRKLWRKHLNLRSDNELAEVLRPLRIEQEATLKGLDEKLNLSLQIAGFIPVEAGQLVHPYDDLAKKLLAQGTNEFTREELRRIGERENLWRGQPATVEDSSPIGIRSFMRWAEHMEDETEVMLDLVRHFDNRHVYDQELWQSTIFPNVKTFLSKYERTARPIRLLLDTHSSVAFAAGYCFEAKSGADVVPVQRVRNGHEVWRPQQRVDPNAYPGLSVTDHLCSSQGQDVAIAVSATHDTIDDVKEYVSAELPQVRRIIECRVNPYPSQSSIHDGTHALILAQRLAAVIKGRSREERSGALNLFAAAPNALMFFFGQVARGFGRCVLYEYDFDVNAPGAYQPSIIFPPS